MAFLLIKADQTKSATLDVRCRDGRASEFKD